MAHTPHSRGCTACARAVRARHRRRGPLASLTAAVQSYAGRAAAVEGVTRKGESKGRHLPRGAESPLGGHVPESACPPGLRRCSH
jgi:hypothetical protein